MSSYEIRVLKKTINRFDKNLSVLDVGSGYGQKLEILTELGFSDFLGVEKNDELVKQGKEKGLNIVGMEEFTERYGEVKFDIILMSHIIEHFQYEDLIKFLEFYLERLKVNGHLVVVTPVMNPYFFNDFDHVKPYAPTGIIQVFGQEKLQFQQYSHIKMELVDLRYVRQAMQLQYFRALALKTWLYRIPRTINRLLHLLFVLSFRLLGRAESWIGIFKKIK